MTVTEQPEGGLQRYLALCDSVAGPPKDGFAYRTHDGLILAEGTFHPWRPRPPWVHKGPDKMCYANAMGVAIQHGLRYVEGYAHGVLIPVLHAWVLDDEGYVIETTWSEERHEHHLYLGIELNPTAVMARCAETGWWGLFGNDWSGEFLRKNSELLAQVRAE